LVRIGGAKPRHGRTPRSGYRDDPLDAPRHARRFPNVKAVMTGSWRVGFVVAIFVSIAACAPAPTPSSTNTSSPSGPVPSGASPTTLGTPVADGTDGITFDRPASWIRWLPNQHQPVTDGPLIYLSTEPLLPACAVAPGSSPNPPDAQGRACTWPLTTLRPGGALVTWWNGRLLSPIPSPDAPITINGRTSGLRVDRPGVCAAIGGDETIDVAIPIGQTSATNISVVACLRGPDLMTAEAQLRDMLISTTVKR
jgi:hypothetical protein